MLSTKNEANVLFRQWIFCPDTLFKRENLLVCGIPKKF